MRIGQYLKHTPKAGLLCLAFTCCITFELVVVSRALPKLGLTDEPTTHSAAICDLRPDTIRPEHVQLPTLIAKLWHRMEGIAIVSHLKVGMPRHEASPFIGKLPVERGQFFEHKQWSEFTQYGFAVGFAKDDENQMRLTYVALL